MGRSRSRGAGITKVNALKKKKSKMAVFFFFFFFYCQLTPHSPNGMAGAAY